MSHPTVASELKQVEMKTDDSTEAEEQSEFEHPLFEEALEEEDVRPESAIEKFKKVIDERQPYTTTAVSLHRWRSLADWLCGSAADVMFLNS